MTPEDVRFEIDEATTRQDVVLLVKYANQAGYASVANYGQELLAARYRVDPARKQDAAPADVTRDGVTRRTRVFRNGMSPDGQRLWESVEGVKGYQHHLDLHVTLL